MTIKLTDKTGQQMRAHISEILYQKGEGFINDNGVDEDVCNEAANEIVLYIKRCLASVDTEV